MMNRRDFTRGSMIAATAAFTGTQANATALQILKNKADEAWSQIVADYDAGIENPDQSALEKVAREAAMTPAENVNDIAIKVYIGTIEFDDFYMEDLLLSAGNDAKRIPLIPELV